MARRGVLILLGCAWTLVLVGPAAAGAAEPLRAHLPAVLAQIRPPIVAQAQPSPQRPRLISLDFKDADINNILRILAEFSGLNVVASEDVKGKVTVKLQNVPWQQALDSVVRAAKLAYVQEGNIIRVDRLENLTKEAEAQFRAEQREVEIEQRRQEARQRTEEQERTRKEAEEKAEFERRKRQRDEEADRRKADFEAQPLVEAIIPLKYAHVGVKRTQVIDFFTDQVRTEEEKGLEDAIIGSKKDVGPQSTGLLSPRGQLTVDQRTNSLIVRDVPDNLTQIRDFILKVDTPAPAILIEARVVEMSKDDARALGVVWGGAFTPRAGPNSPIIDLRGGAGSRVTGDLGPIPPSTAASFPAPVPALTGFAAAPFSLALGWLASNLALDIQLQALEGDRRARVLSRPNLTTLNNQAATIASGTKFPIISLISVGGAQQASITFQDVTTRLQVTPRVVPDTQRLLLNIAVKRETVAGTVTAGSLTAPIVNTRNTITQAEIVDGGTIVIGGLREDTDTNESQGIPWLKRIPVLGWLFKNDLAEARRNELIVFLTAKVVESRGAAVTPGVGDSTPAVPTGQSSGAGPVKTPAVSAVSAPREPGPGPRPAPSMSTVGER